ncbi:hypothetical protein RF55_14428 [Lasius niger]|uniref:Uncharacterized protein n=1 Tax=Lasius niger TaxID=67767 RepID=A0A0J7K7W4_LASNI|nr:hypothetical protein RF55_14428 [Lasius niger]
MGSVEDWRCRACRKKVRTEVVRCKPSDKIFHPGCVQMHKVPNKDKELVLCKGEKENIRRCLEEESAIKRTSGEIVRGQKEKVTREEDEDRIIVKNDGIEESISKILKIVREIKDDKVGRMEIRGIVREVIREEMEGLRKDVEEMKQALSRIYNDKSNEISNKPRSYLEAAKTNKSETVLVVKPRIEQESEKQEMRSLKR